MPALGTARDSFGSNKGAKPGGTKPRGTKSGRTKPRGTKPGGAKPKWTKPRRPSAEVVAAHCAHLESKIDIKT